MDDFQHGTRPDRSWTNLTHLHGPSTGILQVFVKKKKSVYTITIGDESPFLRASHRYACRGAATRGSRLRTSINLAVIVINVILFCILYLLFVSQTSATNHAVSHIKIHGFGYLAFTAQLCRLCPRLLGHA
ncbi:Uncharacterized protein HZ326_4617 [Fusarium oxysporum f. sp. albedinis]|nr:Uncharacterized protein HZ326_4617 [Fusarium oxysporum f. sp. albedinis]